MVMFQPSYRNAMDTISARTGSSSTTSTVTGWPSARRITTRSTEMRCCVTASSIRTRLSRRHADPMCAL
ncbi:Uncharacterised protein [Mycobacterium tuberculosis]|nr:Uncharacterised protein [Mycobacterium tuberculosis]